MRENDFSEEPNLNFTPYQAAHIGVTKHSASLPISNPMLNKPAEAQQPAEPSLATTNVKKVWGDQPVEETKPEPAKPEEPVAVQGGGLSVVPQKPAPSVDKKPEKSKKDIEKEKKANALFAGISGQPDKSDSDESDDSPKAAKVAAPAQSKPAEIGDLLDLGGPSSTNAFQPSQQPPQQQLPFTAANLQTPDFAGIWAQLPNQKQVSVQTALTTPELYKQALSERLGF